MPYSFKANYAMLNLFRSALSILVFSAAVASVSGCALWEAKPEVPLKQATVEQLTGRLQARGMAIQTMKGLFRAQVTGSVMPIAQRVEGAVYYRRPESLRLQGFNHLGGKLFEFIQNRTHYRLDLPAEGKRYAGPLEELKQAKIGRLLQLSRWAVGGVIGDGSSAGRLRTTLSEDGDRYRLDVFQTAPEDRLLRRLWFERRTLQVVEEERMRDDGEVEASMTFEDYRVVASAPAMAAPAGQEAGRTAPMPFKITVVDRISSGSMVLTFHEIVLNPTLKPEELAHIIPERFYCNRRDAATTSLFAISTRPAGRLAPRDLDVLVGTGTLLPGACPPSRRIEGDRHLAQMRGRVSVPRLRVPVSRRVSSVSSRTVMNNVGLPGCAVGEPVA